MVVVAAVVRRPPGRGGRRRIVIVEVQTLGGTVMAARSRVELGRDGKGLGVRGIGQVAVAVAVAVAGVVIGVRVPAAGQGSQRAHSGPEPDRVHGTAIPILRGQNHRAVFILVIWQTSQLIKAVSILPGRLRTLLLDLCQLRLSGKQDIERSGQAGSIYLDSDFWRQVHESEGFLILICNGTHFIHDLGLRKRFEAFRILTVLHMRRFIGIVLLFDVPRSAGCRHPGSLRPESWQSSRCGISLSLLAPRSLKAGT
jgi:hypothetical protein